MQDDIPPFPTDEAFATIEADLGAPVATLFSPLPRAPTAAASLGQVYRTKLKATGEEVAVKVRPTSLTTRMISRSCCCAAERKVDGMNVSYSLVCGKSWVSRTWRFLHLHLCSNQAM
jgi:hypothetical protein